MQNEVIIEPEAAFVIDGAINVVRRMVENTKRFVRFYRGSYIPIGPVYITGHLDRVLPSFFDEISGLPSIVQKVEVIQTSLIDILKMMFNYLNEWKVKTELIVYCANLHISRPAKRPKSINCRSKKLIVAGIVRSQLISLEICAAHLCNFHVDEKR